MTRTGSARDGWAVISCLLLCFVCLNRIQTNNTTTLAPLIECLLFSRSAFCFQPPENNLMAGQRDSGCFSCLSAKTSAGAVECFPSAGEGALPTSLAPNQTCRAVPKRSLSSNPWTERAAAAAERPHTVPETRLSNAGVFFLLPPRSLEMWWRRGTATSSLCIMRASSGGVRSGASPTAKTCCGNCCSVSLTNTRRSNQSSSFLLTNFMKVSLFLLFYIKKLSYFLQTTQLQHILRYITLLSSVIQGWFDPAWNNLHKLYLNLQRPSVRSMATDANKQPDTVLKGFIYG